MTTTTLDLTVDDALAMMPTFTGGEHAVFAAIVSYIANQLGEPRSTEATRALRLLDTMYIAANQHNLIACPEMISELTAAICDTDPDDWAATDISYEMRPTTNLEARWHMILLDFHVVDAPSPAEVIEQIVFTSRMLRHSANADCRTAGELLGRVNHPTFTYSPEAATAVIEAARQAVIDD